MKEIPIDIIGAGIGGLTLAISLKAKGFTVCIYEKSPVLKHVGAGIILANNAMQIYKELGLSKEIENRGNILNAMHITKEGMDTISQMDLEYFKTLYGVDTVAIHRATLQDILLNALRDVEIHLGYKLTHIEKNSDAHNVLKFSNGTKVTSALVIGADGLYSTVRKYLFPTSSIKDAKQICWRGVTQYELPIKYQDKLYEAWGKTARFGFVKISNTQVYWYALKSFTHSAEECCVGDIEQYFSTFHPQIKALLGATPKDTIHTDTIVALNPITQWYKDNICLLGDAAHAMTPNMGQGACQSIEDAYTLAECLSQEHMQEAFMQYQNIRFKKVSKIAQTSWMIGKLSHVKNSFLIKLRNFMLSMTPTSISRKQSEEIFNLHITPSSNIKDNK